MTPLMQAKGSTPFGWQVSMMEQIAAARSPPAFEPVKSHVRRKMAAPRSAFGDKIVNLQTPVLAISCERGPAFERISDGNSERAFRRQFRAYRVKYWT
jgi:hypothetical protein